MLNEEDPVHAAIPPGRTAAGPRPGLPSPQLTFTGWFRAGKAPEVLVAAFALLAAPPACPRLRLAANQLITSHHPDISFRGPQALKVRTGRGWPPSA
jgi:hypothetical protein